MEDVPKAFFDVLEEVVDQTLDMLRPVRRGEGTKADSEKPDVEIGDSKPRLKRWRKCTLILPKVRFFICAFCTEVVVQVKSTPVGQLLGRPISECPRESEKDGIKDRI